ncbi:HNH endonuclease [Rhodopseudomonas sp. P2A-2r]|uniref:HNH endonuclease n=1 Tax=unclassified Rhodopseudomonas TaxID=2638247 RepID=UPI002234CC35|nr:HNH endonuclease [Rhodopseudomonas sp. P2A-2r]UZE49319.1 HNH endonuclease [Rhodopseudomonas sp. P2A-2r]
MAAFAALDRMLAGRGVLPWAEIDKGFAAPGFPEPIRFAGRASGIFKPKEMKGVLSVRTVVPRPGRKVWYHDQNASRDALFAADTEVKYAFKGSDPNTWENVLLREAAYRQTPLIYFVAVAPTIYAALYPAFLVDWDPVRLETGVVFSKPASRGAGASFPKSEIERRYRMVEVKRRVHQAEFREAVLDAYGNRCAITGLPVKDLLDASHIVSDGDEDWGQPVLPNGLLLNKIHHAAYDSDLIGIDPDRRVHISDRLLAQQDDPILLRTIRAMSGAVLRAPRREEDRPDLERLARRFERYQIAN